MMPHIAQSIRAIRNDLEVGDGLKALHRLQQIALEQLPLVSYQKLDDLICQHKAAWQPHLRQQPLRLAILGGYTTQPIRVVLRTMLTAMGHAVEIYEAEYNTYVQAIMTPDSELYAFQPNLVLLATGGVNLSRFPRPQSTAAEVAALRDDVLADWQTLWHILHTQTQAVILQHNYDPVRHYLFGGREGRFVWSKRRFIESLNERLWDFDGGRLRIVDVAGLAIQQGVYHWHSPRWYHHSKHGFDPRLIADYGWLVTGLVRTIQGKSKKCLVIDLDNTLWGGIIGDDGVSGIVLGNGSAAGEAYLSFGQYLKSLRERGIILAINSKNDMDLVRQVFLEHPEMPLRLDDFAAIVCNWQPKSANLQTIAENLNIGLDSIVFVDDSPVECEEVRQAVPAVTVITLPDDPADFIETLERRHLFELLDVTYEDLHRAESYIAQGKIAELKQNADNLASFLADLAMRGRVRSATSADLPRLEQLFKKTNQFNLTGRTFDTNELQAMLEQPHAVVLAAWLTDRLAQYGLVAALAAQIQGDQLVIQNWVMSCRVFSRGFEAYIGNYLVALAQAKGCRSIVGTWLPTERNSYTRNLYASLSFEHVQTEPTGQQIWRLEVASAAPLATQIISETDTSEPALP